MMLNSLPESKCQECYHNAFIYRMIKYDNNKNVGYKSLFKDKYQRALKIQQRDHICVNYLMDLDKLRVTLNEELSEVSQIEKENKKLVNYYGQMIEELIINIIPEHMDEYEKIKYISDFVISHITYSKQWFDYCANTPPGDGLEFDFKNGVPVDKSTNGMLVIGQGTCDDITNLVCYLGSKLDLKINKVFTNYRGCPHALNIITFKDGKKSLFDLTRIIRGDMLEEECFLVSTEDINRNHDYIKDCDHDDIFIVHGFIDTLDTETIPEEKVIDSSINISPYILKLNQFLSKIDSEIYGEKTELEYKNAKSI